MEIENPTITVDPDTGKTYHKVTRLGIREIATDKENARHCIQQILAWKVDAAEKRIDEIVESIYSASIEELQKEEFIPILLEDLLFGRVKLGIFKV